MRAGTSAGTSSVGSLRGSGFARPLGGAGALLGAREEEVMGGAPSANPSANACYIHGMATRRTPRQSSRTKLSIEEESLRLVRASQVETPSIRASYVFPDERTIRIVHVDEDVFPGDGVLPMAFAPDPAEGVHYPSQIALIHPSEERRAALPRGWGSWRSARRVERRDQRSA